MKLNKKGQSMVEMALILPLIILLFMGMAEFSRIFGHSVSNECPPYETEYGKSHVFQKSQGLGDIAGFYKAFGLEASDKAKERHDHISIELEFMYFLIFKENYARENSRAEESDICKDAQKK